MGLYNDIRPSWPAVSLKKEAPKVTFSRMYKAKTLFGGGSLKALV